MQILIRDEKTPKLHLVNNIARIYFRALDGVFEIKRTTGEVVDCPPERFVGAID